MNGAVRIGVAFLCHDELQVAADMVRTWHEGGAAVAIHVDRRTAEADYQAMRDKLADLGDIVWVDRQKCDWGMFSMVEATRAAARALLESDSVNLVNKTLTLDPLHNKKETLDPIARKGGDFVVGAKDNTSARLEAAKRALQDSPLLASAQRRGTGA